MDGQIAIYGAGAIGAMFFEALRSEGEVADYFIDQFTQKREAFGRPVYRLDEVKAPERTRLYVSVAHSVYRGVNAGYDLIADLRSRGFADVVDYDRSVSGHASILRAFAERTRALMQGGSWESIDEPAVRRVHDLLSDAKSRDLLQRLVRFRLQPDATTYVLPDGTTEYFPEDVDVFRTIDVVRFADCGAYCGDTASKLMEMSKKPVDYVVSFEPDEQNLRSLTEMAGHLARRHAGARFFVHPCGVWSKTDILKFDAGKNYDCKIVDADSPGANVVSIPVTSLDVALAGAVPNFIKMDIEGAELEALRGAQRIIREHKPVLAICVYHKPEDLWTLPLYIHELNPGYRMSLRKHAHMAISTVLYCIDG